MLEFPWMLQSNIILLYTVHFMSLKAAEGVLFYY